MRILREPRAAGCWEDEHEHMPQVPGVPTLWIVHSQRTLRVRDARLMRPQVAP